MLKVMGMTWSPVGECADSPSSSPPEDEDTEVSHDTPWDSDRGDASRQCPWGHEGPL